MKCILSNYIAWRLPLTLKSQQPGRKRQGHRHEPAYERTYGFSRAVLLSPWRMEIFCRSSQPWRITDGNADLHRNGEHWIYSIHKKQQQQQTCWEYRWCDKRYVRVVYLPLTVIWLIVKGQHILSGPGRTFGEAKGKQSICYSRLDCEHKETIVWNVEVSLTLRISL